MKIISNFLYSLRQGFKGVFSNKTMSAISVISVSSALIILGIVISIVLNINQFIEVTKDEINEMIKDVLNKVGLADKHNKYPSELSGGECQRVGIARAIVNNPSIIIADECTGNLDIDNSVEILKILCDINSQGITVIMATHDNEILKLFPKRVIEVKKGKIVKDTKRENYENNI